MKYERDHIDPTWEKGRDYQLVCGLDRRVNWFTRDRSLNSKKSNRFLPYRVSHDEIGCVPINPGDLCLFLDPDSNEWVLEEFLGLWWMEKTKKVSAEYHGGLTSFSTKVGIFDKSDSRNLEGNSKGGKRGGKKGGVTTKERGVGIFNPDDSRVRDGRSRGGRRGLQTLFVSLIDGYISNSQNVSRVMRLRGQDPTMRVRLDDIPLSSLIWT